MARTRHARSLDRGRAVLVAAVGAAWLGSVTPAAASDALLLRAVRADLPRAVQAASLAGQARTSDRVQAQYEAARVLAESLRRAPPVSSGCAPLLAAARRFASAQIQQAEGVDKLLPAVTRRGVANAAAATALLPPARAGCHAAPAPPATPTPPQLSSPRSGEAFFGIVRAAAPAGATSATVLVDDVPVAHLAVGSRTFSTRLREAPGRVRVEVRFLAGGRVVGRAASDRVWLLPKASATPVARAADDPAFAAGLASAARAFGGYSAAYVADLASGQSGGYNADARFPAASMVKLGVLVAALGRSGRTPEAGPLAYDLAAMAGWSSNLATNRLLSILGGGSTAGGAALAQATLARLGAGRSTFPGPYLVGSRYVPGRRPADVVAQPPLVSRRVTTARDLAAVLLTLHGAAMGEGAALARAGLSVHAARVALGLLLDSQAQGDNVGLFREAAGPALPLAQKHGWISSARHSAALIYTERGPRLAVVLTYRPGLARRDAAGLGRRVLAVALR